MERNIEQTFQKGIKAHKSGQFDEAGRCYRLILKTQPHHPDANHNLGVLELEAGNLENAISFLRTALEINSSQDQYWISYISALIKLGATDDARIMLSQIKKRGVKGEAFDQLERRLENPKTGRSVISSIEKFYKNSKSTIVNNAAQGWIFSANFDKHFIEKKSTGSETVTPAQKTGTLNRPTIKNAPSLNAKETINALNEEGKIVEKFNKLKALINSGDLNLINDSFTDEAGIDIFTAQQRTFNAQALNIVIIGAGVTGLYLACILKHTLGIDVNVLVLDNRSIKQNTRRPFDREWLTHIPTDLVQKHTPPNIRELLKCFGTNGLIGLQINMLEALLMLSCKDQGVKFYFSPELDHSKLNDKSISVLFDATGGRLNESEYSAPNSEKSDLKLQNLIKGFRYTGINPQNKIPRSEPIDLNITLKNSGALYFPYSGNSKIHIHMFKLIGIPESLLKAVYDFIEPRNASNLFYVWKGALKGDFNEGLVFISLTNKEHDLLTLCVDSALDLKTFLENNSNILSSLNDNIKEFLVMLGNLDNSNQIKINQSFSYAPYINLNAESGHFGDKRIFPIGDAYFCGHPKVGNGLWTHLGFINDLVQGIATAHKNQ